MSILTQLKSIPTTHNGVAVDPAQIKAAINYLSAIHGPTAVRVKWTSKKTDKQIRAAHRSKTIVSEGTAVVGIGTEYKHLPEVVESGKTPGPMKGAEWLLYPWLAVTTEGNLVVRIYPVKETIKSTYYVDGEVVPTADAKAMLYARKPSTSDVLTMHVKVNNLELL